MDKLQKNNFTYYNAPSSENFKLLFQNLLKGGWGWGWGLGVGIEGGKTPAILHNFKLAPLNGLNVTHYFYTFND
jgi:hypothetical protein